MEDYRDHIDQRNSLNYWYPIIKKLPIPMPKTLIIKMSREAVLSVMEGGESKEFEEQIVKIKTLAEQIGYPLFLRTDLKSAKHEWDKGAFVKNSSVLVEHLLHTCESNEMAGIMGLNYSHIVLRQFLELDWRFKAFCGNMPVSCERRYFVEDGKVICHHPYWFKEAIKDAHKEEGKRLQYIGYINHRLPNHWEKMLQEINTETEDEIILLSKFAKLVSNLVEGYWSVDFARGRNGAWYLIDMANGYASEHYPNCNKRLVREKPIRG